MQADDGTLAELLQLQLRSPKPRQEGLTFVLDKGLACRQVEDLIEVAADHIDLVKLGWGTAVVTPGLKRKLAIYREAGISVCCGGTLFEACYLRGLLDCYRRFLSSLGLRYVEISDGTLEIPHDEKLSCIRKLAEDFVVLSEVGSKDERISLAPACWIERILAELDAGSWKVICEARESGTGGLCHANGTVRSAVVDEILAQLDVTRLIFEAPLKAQQVWFLTHMGPHVNLGNIPPSEALSLETLRLGLRSDTLLEFLGPPPVRSGSR